MSRPSFFNQDFQREQLLNVYLDKLYLQLGMSFNRVIDLDMQNKGVDIVVTKKGKDLFVDEKAQLDYINNPLKTFAFEIGYFKGDEHKQGWLFDDRKLTTHYMLITHIAIKEEGVFTSPDDISTLKLLWINRSALINSLASQGIDQAYCEQMEKGSRQQKLSGKILIDRPDHYFYLSDQKAEAPFNLVIRRDELLRIGTQIYPKL